MTLGPRMSGRAGHWPVLALLALATSLGGQAPKPGPAVARSAASIVVDPPVLAIGNDLLAQDLIRSCAVEIRDDVTSRRANGEQGETIRSLIAHNASNAARATRTDASDSYAVYLQALSSSNATGFALGACFYGRRIRQLNGAPLNVKPWVGKYNSGPPVLSPYISPAKRGCISVTMSTPVLSDSGNTYRLNVSLRNACATDQIVIAERYGSLKKLETADWRIMDRTFYELRESPTVSEWPDWKGPVPPALGFVPIVRSRAKPRPILAGQTIRIPYVYDVRAVFADFVRLEPWVEFCPAFSPDGYYQYVFVGEWDTPKQSHPVACKPNREAGKFVRR